MAPARWLRRRDPTLVSVRRAARVTVVACVGFYVCRYGLDNPVMAPYALFGAVALGMLSQIPGSPAQRARTLLGVLPVGWVLLTIGTLLSVTNWAAAAGMFVLGFLVSYAGVGGPRLVGLAGGMQLLYILPCFPPFAPGSLGLRLAGLTIAVVLLAVAELVLWPDPAPVPYPHRLAHAMATLADCVAALADALDGDPRGKDRVAALLPEATEAAEAIRPSRMPPTQRPASASRRDRALTHAAGTARLTLGRTVEMYLEDERDPLNVPAAATLLRQAATCARSAAAWLRGAGPAPDTEAMSVAIGEFRAARIRVAPDGLHPDRLRLGALSLSVGEWTKTMSTAARLAGGAPIHPDDTPPGARPGPFWYAYPPVAWLWWHRFREHLTPRSVYFQGALRLALALAAARLLAGVLDLSHGFWVLLATLTLLRTSAAETRSGLRAPLIGTLVGSVLAGGLLVVGNEPRVYVVALPLVMLIGFAAGPLLGQGWAQALFTVVIALVFAQVAPVDWRLAEARVLDVALGAAIGVVIGLLAWPRGGAGELHRAAANFLAAGAEVVRETTDVLARGGTPGPALPHAREQGRLAEASYALYQTERHAASSATVDWQATLLTGHHAVRGAEALLRSCPTGRLLPCAGQLDATAVAVADGYERFAAGLRSHQRTTLREPAGTPPVWPMDLGPDLYHLADIRVWLTGLGEDLTRIAAPPTPVGPPTAPAPSTALAPRRGRPGRRAARWPAATAGTTRHG